LVRFFSVSHFHLLNCAVSPSCSPTVFICSEKEAFRPIRPNLHFTWIERVDFERNSIIFYFEFIYIVWKQF